jgi:hypothetical protein
MGYTISQTRRVSRAATNRVHWKRHALRLDGSSFVADCAIIGRDNKNARDVRASGRDDLRELTTLVGVVYHVFGPLASLRSQAARMLHGYDVTMVQSSTAVKPHDNTVSEFLDRLRRLVIDEALTAKQNLLELWSQPLAARVRQGRAIEGLRVVKVGQDGRIELACDRNQARFREGNAVGQAIHLHR